jgi:hypothetical protein
MIARLGLTQPRLNPFGSTYADGQTWLRRSAYDFGVGVRRREQHHDITVANISAANVIVVSITVANITAANITVANADTHASRFKDVSSDGHRHR